MKKIATQILTALLLATAMASCSTPVLESTNESIALETPQASELIGEGTIDTDTSLQATATPCFTYTIKKYTYEGSKTDLGGTMYGSIRVKKSPRCKAPLKVSFEGSNTGRNTPESKRITAQFDETMYLESGNTYYAYFDIYMGSNIQPGTYGVAFRVKGGNVNKAVVAAKINVLPGS
jgi:hypothetical protein